MTPAELALADELITQGLQFWANFQAQKAAGTLTQADLTAAAQKLDVDIAQLTSDIAAQSSS